MIKIYEYVFDVFKYLYICVMELLKCAICGAENLIKLPSTIKVDQKRIVCENEYFKHIRIGQVDFLARTELAIQEEREERMMALNNIQMG